jgi:hypothetical protein
MTFTRSAFLCLIAILAVDYEFGSGRLIQSVSAQTAALGYKLSDNLSYVVRHISPR